MQNIKHVITVGLFIFLISCAFAGSNLDAEYYGFKVSEEKLIDAIEKYKNDTPQFNLYSIKGDRIIELKNEFDDKNYYYNVFFYTKEDKVGFQCFVSTRDKKAPPSRLGILAIAEHYADGDTYSTRMEKLSKERKKKVLAIFEEKVLKGLKEQIAKDEKKQCKILNI